MKKILPVIVFGEVLFDIFPEERHLGGAPFNFALHLHRLGIPIIFVSRIGKDNLGKEILSFAQKNKFPALGIQSDSEKPTGEVVISPNAFGGPRFEILADRAYDFIAPDPLLDSLKDLSWVYFGSLAQRNFVSRQTIQKFIKDRKGKGKVVLDLNLRPPFYNYSIVESSLVHCDLLKVNGQELDELKNLLGLQ